MADAAQIQQRVQSPAPFSTWVGFVLLLVVFGAIAVAIIGPAPRGNTYEQQRAENRVKKLKELRDEDAKVLNDYAWIDKSKGSVRLPIERAMELTVAELAKKKPAAAGPIATPAASATPTGSAAPAGAAVATPAPTATAQPSGTAKPTSVAGPSSEARGQPAAAVNPAPVQRLTQPGAGASPAASPKSSVAVPAGSAAPASSTTPPGSRLPVRGASPTPPGTHFMVPAPSPTSTAWKFTPNE